MTTKEEFGAAIEKAKGLPAQSNERSLQPRERLQLVAAEGLAAERHLPVEIDDLIEREAAGALHHGAAEMCPHISASWGC